MRAEERGICPKCGATMPAYLRLSNGAQRRIWDCGVCGQMVAECGCPYELEEERGFRMTRYGHDSCDEQDEPSGDGGDITSHAWEVEV